MFKTVTNMPIFFRLLLAFGLAAVFPSIVIAVLGFQFVNTLNQHADAAKAVSKSVSIVRDQQVRLQTMDTNLQSLIALGLNNKKTVFLASGTSLQQDLINRITVDEENFTNGLATMQHEDVVSIAPNMQGTRDLLNTSTEGAKLITQQRSDFNAIALQNQGWDNYKALQDGFTNNPDPQQNYSQQRVETYLQQLDTVYQPLHDKLTALTADTDQITAAVTTINSAQTTSILIDIVIALVITIAIVSLIGYVLNRTITDRLNELALLTRRIKKGETDVRAQIEGHDEIYLVANSMNDMLDSIVRLIQETQGQRDLLQGQVEKLVSEVSGVGEGDLSVQAEVTADALGVLADSFNYMVEELGSLVVRVKMVAHEVENSTSNILDRMTQLVENSDIQIQQVGDAAAEVERMAASSRQVAEHAQSLYTIAREARVNANAGRGAVQMTIQGMGRINQNVQATATKVNVLGERSREINNIIEVISGIAHQTNRLALDAAIQAAMAGENGKGFGAVAADIRRLAERAKEQTGIITKIVRSIRDDIGSVAVSMQDTERETSVGAELTQEAGQSLELIFSVVERQASEIENINQMATQQLQSTSSIVQIMRAVNEGNRIGSASTREASHNMERLARLVEQLRSSVEAFKIRDDQSYYMPTSQVRIESPADEVEEEMTVSGIFRTISATVQPSSPQHPQPAGGFPGLRTPGPSGFLPAPPPRSPFDSPYNGYNYDGNEYSGNNGNDRNY